MSMLIKEDGLILKCKNSTDKWIVVGEVIRDVNGKEHINWFSDDTENKYVNYELKIERVSGKNKKATV